MKVEEWILQNKKKFRVSLIIIQYGSCNLLLNFLNSLNEHPDRALIDEIIIVNNGLSLEKNFRECFQDGHLPVRIIDNIEASYSSAVNLGAAASSGDYLIISNNDIELLLNWSIKPLLNSIVKNRHIGIIGPQLVYPDGSWQRSHGKVPSILSALVSIMMLDSIKHVLECILFHFNKQKAWKVEYIDGAFMVVNRRCFFQLGGFDEGFSFYGEDADFCYRAWHAGWIVLFEPATRIKHIRGATSTNNTLEIYMKRLMDAQEKFMQKHYGNLQARVYKWLIKLAILERKILYFLIAKITHDKKWQKRAEEARVRYNAMGEET
jgi:GT2 family glycosyltransferase